MRPEGFDERRYGAAWSRWVLAHGLPGLPGPSIAVGESVPVAYWIGPRTAAVLHIRHVEDEDEPEPENWNEVDVHLFVRIDEEWEDVGGGGAGGWSGDTLVPEAVPADVVRLDGMQGADLGGAGVKALWGELGTAAAVAEVVQFGEVARRPVEAPAGLYVVSAALEAPFTVRVLDAHGVVLAEIAEQAGWPDDGPWPR